MEHRKSEFIPGIEGLRAIAILAVLINHLSPDFMPGGYLGVDLFFVISGYVVSRSLDIVSTNSLKNYLVMFYSKRLKRLFPALLISFIFITLIGTLLFEGIGKSTVRTGAASLLGLSNLYLIHINTDYFGLGSEFNLFLPTWSLGIEEQFYFFFPLFLFWLKVKKKSIVGWLIVVLILSFCTFVIAHYLSKNFQYYFPLSRLWELMAGSLLYFYSSQRNDKFKNKALIPLFLVLLGFTFFIPNIVGFFTTYSYFSVAAPTVCLISAVLIYLSSKIDSVFLTNRVMMYLGKISYSIYLYHFAVLKLINPGPSWPLRLLTFVVILLFAMASFHFIETPIRNTKWKIISAKKLIAFSSATATLCLLIFAGTRYMPEKDPFMRPTKAEYKIDRCNFLENTDMDCRLPSEGSKKLFFIGDSHSYALTPVMVKLHDLEKYEIYSISSNGLLTTTMDGYTRKDVQATAMKAIEFIDKNVNAFDTVISTNQLMTWFSHTLNDDPELHRLTFNGKLISHEEALNNYIAENRAWAVLLKDKLANLIITAPIPDFPIHPSKCYSPLKVALGWSLTDTRCQTSRANQEERRKDIMAALNKLASEQSNIRIFDPIDLICDKEVCNNYKSNKPVYYDDDHINFNLSSDIYSQLSLLLK